jgi:hypothetical protein
MKSVYIYQAERKLSQPDADAFFYDAVVASSEAEALSKARQIINRRDLPLESVGGGITITKIICTLATNPADAAEEIKADSE